ncbi:MAG: hypothetical protein ACLQMT_12470 [Candidatus Acidiferrales bacterium]
MTIRSYHPGVYASAQFLYQSQYAKWSSNYLFAGCLFPLSKHIQLDTYYEHENNTGPHPNHQVNAAGLVMDLYFPPYKKLNTPQQSRAKLASVVLSPFPPPILQTTTKRTPPWALRMSC